MRIRLLAIVLFASRPGVAGAQAPAGDRSAALARPYRVLVVIGDQWDDPGSYCIDTTNRYGGVTRRSGKDFLDVITMLKIWGIPFDVLRLDQQRLQINRFLNGMAEPNYACVIWLADPDKLQGYSAHYETLRRVVEDYGISLILLFDHVRAGELCNLIGVEYQGAVAVRPGDPRRSLAITGEHFITSGTVGKALTDGAPSVLRVVQCRARPGARVLGRFGDWPQLVARDVSPRTKVVWIGGGHDWFDKVPAMRTLFRKALVHCLGYGLFNDSFENAFILIMDDMGCSEHAYSLRWHYPTPDKETIIKYLVEPLARRGLVMVQNVTPGYANPVTRMVENPWTTAKFTDPFGNMQDYPSTKEGLDEGVRRGVLEIQSHRAWTHLTWDLDSPPGPWWDAPIEGERAEGGWYNETFDTRRNAPVPSNDMLFIYRVGRDAIQRQFNLTPLAVTVQPGVGLDHDTGRLAAIAGYGVDRWHYLGLERLIQFSIPKMAPEQFTCHDLDLVEKRPGEITSPASNVHRTPTSVLRSAPVTGSRILDLRNPRWTDRWKDKRWMGFNEYCAYLHTRVDVTGSVGLAVRLDYDPHYCRHFAKNPSRWTLELSDEYRKRAGAGGAVSVDGQAEKQAVVGPTVIAFPPGEGSHQAQIRAE